MRAWVPKKREHEPKPAGSDTSSPRRARVRNRLLVGIALSALAVVGAGTPGLVAAARTLTEDQELIRLAELNRQSIALAHAVADERDALLTHLAQGRGDATGRAFAAERVRVDQRARELRAADAPKPVLAALDDLSRHRRAALSGNARVLTVHQAYTEVLETLADVSGGFARALPARAQQTPADRVGPAGPAEALPALVRATEHASATRGLLLAALARPGADGGTAAAAQQAWLREQAALADFQQLAGAEVRDSYARTVSGPDVTDAERLLARLTDAPRLDAADRTVSRKRLQSVLTARLHLMRSVAATVSAAEAERLADLRKDDVTALQIHVALVGAALLLAVASGLHTARSVVRPLAVLRRGGNRVAGDPEHEDPLGFTGRNDEFAEVARAFNRLHAHLRERLGTSVTDGDGAASATARGTRGDGPSDTPAGDATGRAAAAADDTTDGTTGTTTLRATGPYLVDPATLGTAGAEPASGRAATSSRTRDGERPTTPGADSAVGRIPSPRGEQPRRAPEAAAHGDPDAEDPAGTSLPQV